MSDPFANANLLSLIKMLVVMVVLLVLVRKKINLGLSMIVSSVLLGVLFGMGAWSISVTAVQASYEGETLNLVAALLLILILQRLMDLQRVVVSLKGLTGDHRVVVALMPAIVGLLPTAGGAVFSAPLVDEASSHIGMSAEQKSTANYLLRHIWEYSAPIYPSVILTAQLFQVSLRDLILAQVPFTLVAVVVGVLAAFRGTRNNAVDDEMRNSFWTSVVGALVGLSPIVVVIVLVIGFGVNLPLSLLLAVLALLFLQRYRPHEFLDLLRRSFSLSTVFLVLGVMVFKEVLTHSGALQDVAAALSALGVPAVLLFFLLPFVTGLLTGIAVAYVGVAFPLLLGITGQSVELPLLAFAFASGFAGVMLSPAHLCFVLTIQHFKADFAKVYRMLLVPQASIVLTALALYLAHR